METLRVFPTKKLSMETDKKLLHDILKPTIPYQPYLGYFQTPFEVVSVFPPPFGETTSKRCKYKYVCIYTYVAKLLYFTNLDFPEIEDFPYKTTIWGEVV